MRNLSSLIIKGGKPLIGEVAVRGAKNSVSKIMVASLLTEESCVLKNVPDIDDVRVVSEMIKMTGGSAKKLKDGVWEMKNKKIKPANEKKTRSIAGKSRLPILFAGPLLNRLGKVFIPNLGGCPIGPRPVDFHISALKKFGAKIKKTNGGIYCSAEKLKGAAIKLPYPSVGATEQTLLTAVLAQGKTILSNAAQEPEIMDLIAVLKKMGAKISLASNRVMTIKGVAVLKRFEHSAAPDRLEAASWACAAAATNGEIFVRNAEQNKMTAFLEKYRELGGIAEVRKNGIAFRRGIKLKPVAIETDVHPGFMTDWQQPFTILMTQAKGRSSIHETVYENRFGYVSALKEMGADIKLTKKCLSGKKCRFSQKYFHTAIIKGPSKIQGKNIMVPDLRAGFSYIIAALTAEGISRIDNIQIISRGYENFTEKLQALGAEIIQY